MSDGKPSWRWLRIFVCTLVIGVAAQAMAGWTGWLILVAGLGVGYIVAATERTQR